MIKRFLSGEIGLDIPGSDKVDVFTLTHIIEADYGNPTQDDEPLFDYFCETNTGEWLTLIYDPPINQWNAFKGDSDQKYREKHEVFTAAEILNSKTLQPIEESELLSLF